MFEYTKQKRVATLLFAIARNRTDSLPEPAELALEPCAMCSQCLSRQEIIPSR